MIYRAYVSGRPDLWKAEIEKLESLYRVNPVNELLEELVMARYGYIAFSLKEGDRKEVAAQLELARKNLEILKKNQPGLPRHKALEAAFTGFEISISPLRAIVLAGEAKRLTEEAYNDDPDCLLCISVMANQLNFTPAVFGGSTSGSIPYYKKIIEAYEYGVVPIENDWNYINTLVILAGAYEKLGQWDDACETYEKILDRDPAINWVKNKLYPACIESKEKAKE